MKLCQASGAVDKTSVLYRFHLSADKLPPLSGIEVLVSDNKFDKSRPLCCPGVQERRLPVNVCINIRTSRYLRFVGVVSETGRRKITDIKDLCFRSCIFKTQSRKMLPM